MGMGSTRRARVVVRLGGIAVALILGILALPPVGV